jgi:hypothetical protein
MLGCPATADYSVIFSEVLTKRFPENFRSTAVLLLSHSLEFGRNLWRQ